MADGTTGRNPVFAEGVPKTGATSWAGGKITAGNNPGALTYINPWGVLYRVDGNPPGSDARIEVSDLALDVMYAAGVWTRAAYLKRVDGQLYEADFAFPQDVLPATYYSMAPDPIITDLPLPNWAYHFYAPKALITDTILGLCVSFTARMVAGLEGTVLAQSGCDFKNSDGSTILESWAGSMRPVTSQARRFYGSTLSLAQVQANPPPFVLDQFS